MAHSQHRLLDLPLSSPPQLTILGSCCNSVFLQAPSSLSSNALGSDDAQQQRLSHASAVMNVPVASSQMEQQHFYVLQSLQRINDASDGQQSLKNTIPGNSSLQRNGKGACGNPEMMEMAQQQPLHRINYCSNGHDNHEVMEMVQHQTLQRNINHEAMRMVQQQSVQRKIGASHGNREVMEIAEQDLQGTGLMRYHSAPSSVLASMNDDFHNHDTSELARIIPRNLTIAKARLELKEPFQPTNGACSLSNGGEHEDAMKVDASCQQDPNISKLIASSLPFKQAVFNSTYPGLNLNPDSTTPHFAVSMAPAPSVNYVLDRPLVSTLPAEDVYRPGCENDDNQIINGQYEGSPSTSRNCLLRHSSSPAGLLSLLNDGLPPSSSGNSSEEGSYERKGAYSGLGSYSWTDNIDDPGNNVLGSPTGVSFASGKRVRELDFSGSAIRNSQQRDVLEHGSLPNHLRIPMSSNGPQHDSIYCHARAKRGCATHPRSIAERVRRTKISERMKKLQELVPHLDKQTNTSEMLDEVVEYVKVLQGKVEELTENQLKCTCSNRKPTHEKSG